MTEFGFAIDFIGATFNPEQAMTFAKKMGYKAWSSDVPCVPMRGYSHAVELETGLRINWNEKRDEMGVHIIMSGSTLRWYADKSVDGLQVLKWVKQHGGRTSRVDLAIDVKNGGLKLEHFCEETRILMKTRGRQPQIVPVGTQKNGWTVYVGARTSEKMLRIYDKIKEQKMKEGDYVRIELETKGEVGHAVGHNFAEYTHQEAYEMASTLISDFVQFDNDIWREALSQRATYKLEVPKNDATDTLGWLVKTCAPALAKQIAKRPNDGILDAFVDELRKKLAEYEIELV